MNFGICLLLSASPFLNFFFPTFFSPYVLLSQIIYQSVFLFFVMSQPGVPWISSLLLLSLSSASLDAPFLAVITSLDEIPAALRDCPSLGRDFSSVFPLFPLCICVFSSYSNHSSCPSHLLALSHTQLWFRVNSAGCKINFCY